MTSRCSSLARPAVICCFHLQPAATIGLSERGKPVAVSGRGMARGRRFEPLERDRSYSAVDQQQKLSASPVRDKSKPASTRKLTALGITFSMKVLKLVL